jgi:hypothetical protein
VAGSVPEREFEETEHKAAAMRRAIELAAGGRAAADSERDTAGDRAADSRAAADSDRGPASALSAPTIGSSGVTEARR